jgi:glycosyltransferase involved in cell wall biosynthesis
MVTTSYPLDNSDGSGIFIQRLAVAMNRAGAKITVLAPGDRYAKTKEWDKGIRIIRFLYAPRFLMRLAYGNGGISENLQHHPWLIILVPFFLFALGASVFILSRPCDVIHANWLPTGLLSLPAKKIRKKILVITLRGRDLKKKPSKLLGLLMKQADAITTVNHKWAQDVRETVGGKVFYTPNGIELPVSVYDHRSRLGIRSDEILVLYIGSLILRKGADILAKTAKIVWETHRSIRFLVAGPGNPEEFGLNNLPNVLCIGKVSPDEVFHLYKSADIFILPSRHEGRPNALLEAMASGLPSVAANIPGVTEILTNECGIITARENPEAMASAICNLAEDSCKRNEMGAQAKTKVASICPDWNTSAENYLNIFRSLRNKKSDTICNILN